MENKQTNQPSEIQGTNSGRNITKGLEIMEFSLN